MEKITIHCDGASRGNPGKAAAAFVVLKDGKVIHKNGKLLGTATNNFAEYSAVLEALEWLVQNDSGVPVDFILDSQLVVNQLKGLYKIKNGDLMLLAQKVKTLEGKLSARVSYTNVLREKNKIADLLANDILDGNFIPASIKFHSEN